MQIEQSCADSIFDRYDYSKLKRLKLELLGQSFIWFLDSLGQ